MKRILFFLLFFSAVTGWGQVILNYKIKMANNYYDKYLYGEAITLYEEIIHADPKNIEAKKRLANCYRQTNDTRNAERVLSQLVVEDSVGLLNKLFYAQVLSENGKYEEARKWYKKYDAAIAIDGRGKRFLTAYADVNKFYKDSARWAIEFLNLNSHQADFSPMFYKKGIIFCSARSYGGAVKHVFGWDQSAFLNLYYVEDTNLIQGKPFFTDVKNDKIKSFYDSSGHVNGHSEDTRNSGNDSHTLGYYGNTFLTDEDKWLEAFKPNVKPFSKNVNSKYHEGPSCFSAQQDSMVLTRNGYHGGKLKTSKDGVTKLKIYSSKLVEGKWQKPNPIKFSKFQYFVKFTSLNTSTKSGAEQDTAYLKEIELDDNQFSVSHPCLNKDNSKLFFVSDAPIGFGGTDIYVCDWVEGKWSAPINCGKNVNTEGNEMFPFVDSNGNLYFSSDGWGGLGGLDIYYSTTETNIFGTKDNIFSKPQNLGFPINSKKDDFGIITNPEFTSGYFSSNRKTGGNDDDIYRFKFVGGTSISVDGMVVKKSTGYPLDSVKIVLTDGTKRLDSTLTPMYGKFNFKNLPAGVDYVVMAERKGYHPKVVNLNSADLKRGDTSTVKVELQPKELFIYAVGKVVGADDRQAMTAAKLKFYNNCTGQTDEIFPDQNGNYKYRLKENCCYSVTAIRDNCGTNTLIVSTANIQDDTQIENNFHMMCKGDIVKVENIYYDQGKADIRQDAAAELDKMYEILTKYPEMRIEVRSHTDSRGDDAKNLKLSDDRAKAVDNYLTQKGIAPNRVIGKGYGETKLINNCEDGIECDDDEHAINRRTEFLVLTMGKPLSQTSIDADASSRCNKFIEQQLKKADENAKIETKAQIVKSTLDDFGKTETDAPKAPVEVKKEEPKPVTPITTKTETKPVTPVVEVKKEEPKPIAPVTTAKTETKPVEVKKDVPITSNPLLDVKSDEVNPITTAKTETKPVEVKKEEPKPVTPVEVKKEEPKPVTPVTTAKTETKPVEVKKEEPKPVTPVEVKKEEPKPVTPVTTAKTETKPVEVKKEEPKPVTPVVKKEEPKPVTPVTTAKTETKPVEVKKEEPKPVTPVVKKEEPKPVTPVTTAKTETKPVEVKKEEPKPVTPEVKKEEPKPVTPPTTAKTETKPAEVKKEEPASDDPFGDILTRTDDRSTCTIKGVVLKNGSPEILNGVKLTIKTKDGKQIATTTSVLNGTFTFNKLASLTDYEIFAEKPGFFMQKINVNSAVLQPGQTGNVKIQLDVDANSTATTNASDVVITLKGKVVDAKTKAPAANISITVTNNIDKTSQEIKTDASGNYTIILKKQAHFTLKAAKGTCTSDPVNKSTIGVQTSQTMEQDLTLNCP